MYRHIRDLQEDHDLTQKQIAQILGPDIPNMKPGKMTFPPLFLSSWQIITIPPPIICSAERIRSKHCLVSRIYPLSCSYTVKSVRRSFDSLRSFRKTRTFDGAVIVDVGVVC